MLTNDTTLPIGTKIDIAKGSEDQRALAYALGFWPAEITSTRMLMTKQRPANSFSTSEQRMAAAKRLGL